MFVLAWPHTAHSRVFDRIPGTVLTWAFPQTRLREACMVLLFSWSLSPGVRKETNDESWIQQGRAAQSGSEGALGPGGAGPGGSEQGREAQSGREGELDPAGPGGSEQELGKAAASRQYPPAPLTPTRSRLGDANTELLQGEFRSPVAVRAARGDESLLKLSPLMTHMCQVSSRCRGLHS